MKVTIQSTWLLCLALGLVIVLGIVFFLLPIGWKIIPLFLIAVVIGTVLTKLRTPCDPGGGEAGELAGNDPMASDGEAVASCPEQRPPLVPRLNRAFGPIAAGMIIDLVDLALFGPGHIAGLLIGGIAGYWMGSALGLNKRTSLWCALAAGIYCSIPGSEYIPLGTIVGACVRFWESGTRQKTHKRNKAARMRPAAMRDHTSERRLG